MGKKKHIFTKVTIGDRIRSMSDEELVKYFWDLMPDEEFCTNCGEETSDCDKCRLAWLKKPWEETDV